MDELERELRRVLHDDRWSLDAPADTLDRVHARAARRGRRHRVAAGGLSALVVIAVVTTALAVPPVKDRLTAGSGGQGSGASRAQQASSPTPSPGERTGKESRVSPSTQQVSPHPTSGAVLPVPDGFKAASVTAVSTRTFWVLGTAPCGKPTCTTIARTRDGGQTFTGVRAPDARLATGHPTRDTVRDLRFAGLDDGYAFGGALWSTHDGGDTWSRQQLPGSVIRLAAAHGTAWAIVDTGGNYRLYRSATSADAWRRVALPTTLEGPRPDLAVQGDQVVIVGSAGVGTAGAGVTLVSVGGAFHAHRSPCDAALTATLSPSSGGVWMFCATGTSGVLFVSADGGRGWNAVNAAPPGGWPNSAVVGARNKATSVIAAGGRLFQVEAETVTPSRTPGLPNGASFKFIGFTTSSLGYAVLDEPTPSSLWRTTDGGRSWHPVSYH